MSWVITRKLVKSGGNNIAYRIGQFNKWSSPKAMCKYLYNNLIHSGLLETFQKKIKMSNKLFLLKQTHLF